jgi:hypothetical protein
VGEQYRLLGSSSSFLHSLPCYLVPLKHKYSPQHFILKHPLPTLLPECQRPSFTPIQNNRLAATCCDLEAPTKSPNINRHNRM